MRRCACYFYAIIKSNPLQIFISFPPKNARIFPNCRRCKFRAGPSVSVTTDNLIPKLIMEIETKKEKKKGYNPPATVIIRYAKCYAAPRNGKRLLPSLKCPRE
ncbi:hypothetical protein PUN28_000098 [Cardiocondyla obscurior]|uniref:Uncharacterized protein n=1 Tax=Cardiocondyla obscurior TaxID=286306 RepID=A0AAW2GXV0_9HYME